MEKKKDSGLVEQEAPWKNTDRAFVRVSKDGSPEMPAHPAESEQKERQEERIETKPEED